MPISKDNKKSKAGKKKYNTRYSKQDKKLKQNENSDSSSEENDDNSTYSDSESEEEMDSQEYRKFLHKIFPSKHLKNKIINDDKIKKSLKKIIENDE